MRSQKKENLQDTMNTNWRSVSSTEMTESRHSIAKSSIDWPIQLLMIKRMPCEQSPVGSDWQTTDLSEDRIQGLFENIHFLDSRDKKEMYLSLGSHRIHVRMYECKPIYLWTHFNEVELFMPFLSSWLFLSIESRTYSVRSRESKWNQSTSRCDSQSSYGNFH